MIKGVVAAPVVVENLGHVTVRQLETVAARIISTVAAV